MIEAGWLLLGLGGVVATWQWSNAARERVDAVSRRVCQELDLQRLDEAVALRAIRLRRTAHGVALVRLFSFEFSCSGADRRRADVCLDGNTPLWVHLDHPDGPIHIEMPAAP